MGWACSVSLPAGIGTRPSFARSLLGSVGSPEVSLPSVDSYTTETNNHYVGSSRDRGSDRDTPVR